MLLSWGTSLPRPARPDAGRREAPAEIGLPPSTFSEGPLPFSSEAGDLSKLEKASTEQREGSDPDNGSHQDDSGGDPRLDPLFTAASPELGFDDLVVAVAAALSQVAHQPLRLTDHDDRSIPPEGDNGPA